MKTERMRLLEYERGKTIEDILVDLADHGLSISQMADDLGISVVTFYDWCNLLKAELGTRRIIRFPERESVVSA